MIAKNLGNIYNLLGEEAIEFIENKVKIRSSFYYENGKFVPVSGKQLVPFRLTPKQTEFVYVMTHPKTAGVILKKPRQVGMTTLICALALFFAQKYEHYNVYIISIKHEDAMFVVDTIMNIIHGFMERGDETSKIITKKEYENLKGKRLVRWIKLANGSIIYPLTTTVTAGSGLTSGMFILDEFAKNPYAQEIYQSSIPALSTIKDSKFAVISTPFKLRSGEYYENFYIDAYLNDLQMIKLRGGLDKVEDRVVVPIEINWWEAPNRDNEKYFLDPANFTPDIEKNKWIREQISKLTKGIATKEEKDEILNQELWGEFVFYNKDLTKKNIISESTDAVKTIIIENIRNRYTSLEVAGRLKKDRGVYIYEEPSNVDVYYIFVDWATGVRTSDTHAHAFAIWKLVNEGNVVASVVADYRGICSGPEYLELLKFYSTYYNALIIPELNGIGNVYWKILKEEHPLVLNDIINNGKNMIEKRGITLTKTIRNFCVKTFLEVGLEGERAYVVSPRLADELAILEVRPNDYRISGKPRPITDKNGVLVDVINDDLLIFPYSVGFTTIFLNITEISLGSNDKLYIPSIRKHFNYMKQVIKPSGPQAASFEEQLWRGLLAQGQAPTQTIKQGSEIELLMKIFDF